MSRCAMWLLAAALVLAASCSFEPDYADTRYVCRLDRCPDGFVCIDEICVIGSSDAAPTVGGGPAPFDAGPGPDAATPDAGKPTCDQQFGSADEYLLCSEETATCRFNVMAGESSCDQQCAMFGGTCVDADDSNAGDPCVAVASTGCGTPHNSVICTCMR